MADKTGGANAPPIAIKQGGRKKMRRRLLQMGILWRPLSALILALCLIPVGSHPVAALSVDEYFSYSYNVEFGWIYYY